VNALVNKVDFLTPIEMGEWVTLKASINYAGAPASPLFRNPPPCMLGQLFTTLGTCSTKAELMKGLGNLEEVILLLIMGMPDDAYGFSVSEAYRAHTGTGISISAVHTVLSRLEKKGFVVSQMRGATEARGGRRKRIFVPTSAGKQAVAEIKASRQKLWANIPDWA
jgi:PadR family transcriptional regulator, regulatory protein PadR